MPDALQVEDAVTLDGGKTFLGVVRQLHDEARDSHASARYRQKLSKVCLEPRRPPNQCVLSVMLMRLGMILHSLQLIQLFHFVGYAVCDVGSSLTWQVVTEKLYAALQKVQMGSRVWQAEMHFAVLAATPLSQHSELFGIKIL